MALASFAMAFAGMASAQVNCTNAAAVAAGGPSANAVFLRAEGKTEQVADMSFNCDVSTALAGASTMTVTVYLSPAVTITSKKVGTGDGAANEATASATVSGGGGTTTAAGTISANSVSFTVITPAAAAATTMRITVTNIKVDATAIATGSGVPTALTETVFVGGTGAVPAVLSTTPSVGFVLPGLNATSIKSSGTTNNLICSAITSAAVNFNVEFAENFGNALKLRGGTGNAALNDWFTNNTETGLSVTAGGGNNTATSGTRVKVVFNNVPANVTVYVPLVINATGPSTGTMTLTSSETGAYSAVTASSASGAPAGSAAVSLSSGSGSAVYEYTGNAADKPNPGANDATQEAYKVPVYLVASSGAVPAPAGAITATVSFAPIGASSNVPNFVSGSSTTTVNGSNFTACNTTLLFPFVTNQLGFDTGIAISNTSSDLLALKNGAPINSVNAQSGTCSLNFFGDNAPADAVVTSSVATGKTYAAAASTLAPGFQGYAIAVCNFQYAHGFAYVVYNLTQNNGAAMGYLPLVINGTRAATETLNQ
jgi:hypothetical protein